MTNTTSVKARIRELKLRLKKFEKVEFKKKKKCQLEKFNESLSVLRTNEPMKRKLCGGNCG